MRSLGLIYLSTACDLIDAFGGLYVVGEGGFPASVLNGKPSRGSIRVCSAFVNGPDGQSGSYNRPRCHCFVAEEL